jgi:hypothetical protein
MYLSVLLGQSDFGSWIAYETGSRRCVLQANAPIFKAKCDWKDNLHEVENNKQQGNRVTRRQAELYSHHHHEAVQQTLQAKTVHVLIQNPSVRKSWTPACALGEASKTVQLPPLGPITA